MLAAFLTTILFSISGVSAMRTTRFLSGLEANFWRLLVSTLLLGLYAHAFGAGFHGAALGWFVASGLVGFGMGDIALFQALPKLGSRLVILIVHCVAAPLAAAVEWLAMGKPMTSQEILASSLILFGVATALFPDPRRRTTLENAAGRRRGVEFALIAAVGQGFGALLSRHAFEIATRAGEHVDGVSAAYQRIWAGLVLGGLAWVWVARVGGPGSNFGSSAGLGGAGGARKSLISGFKTWFPWVLLNALAGPTLGVSCFQWALAERGTGVVLPIVALTPLVIVPFSVWMEGERPSGRSLIGGIAAVVGAVIHAVIHTNPPA